MPVLSVAAEVLSNSIQKSCWKSQYKNHTNNNTDNIKFLELNAGPEYYFQLKCGSLNTVLFITIALGQAFPIFYINGLFALTIQYITERYSLAMIYRLPPKFSKDITNLNVKILAHAPLVAAALGFWFFGNRQLFGYEVDEKLHKNELILSHHLLGRNRLMHVEIIYLIFFFLIGTLLIFMSPTVKKDQF